MIERRDRIRVQIEGKEYYVVGGEFQEMLAAVKQVVGRRFVSELKVWQLPGTADEIQHQLAISGYELEGGGPIEDSLPAGQALPGRSGGDRIRIKVGEQQLAVIGGTFQDMLEAVKRIPGRRFDSAAKIWEIPGDVGVIKGMIEAAGFQLEGAENISPGSLPPPEPLQFSDPGQPPPFEPPDFYDDDEIPPFEPPDWWNDERMPPPLGPPDEWQDEFSAPPFFDEPNPFDNEPSPLGAAPVSAPPAAAGRDSGDRIRIRLGEVTVVVTGGSFQEMLAVVKNIPGRRFNGQEKVWEIPEDVGLDSVSQAVNAAGFVLIPGE